MNYTSSSNKDELNRLVIPLSFDLHDQGGYSLDISHTPYSLLEGRYKHAKIQCISLTFDLLQKSDKNSIDMM